MGEGLSYFRQAFSLAQSLTDLISSRRSYWYLDYFLLVVFHSRLLTYLVVPYFNHS